MSIKFPLKFFENCDKNASQTGKNDYSVIGNVKTGNLSGQCQVFYKNSLLCSGVWKSNVLTGEAKLTGSLLGNTKFVSSLKGNFLKGHLEGIGEKSFKNCSSYIGNFKEGLFEGHGKTSYFNTDKLSRHLGIPLAKSVEGIYSANRETAQVSVTFNDDDVFSVSNSDARLRKIELNRKGSYEGKTETKHHGREVFHGEGFRKYSTGGFLLGDFLDGSASGFCVQKVFTNNESCELYFGKFKKGQRDGEGLSMSGLPVNICGQLESISLPSNVTGTITRHVTFSCLLQSSVTGLCMKHQDVHRLVKNPAEWSAFASLSLSNEDLLLAPQEMAVRLKQFLTKNKKDIKRVLKLKMTGLKFENISSTLQWFNSCKYLGNWHDGHPDGDGFFSCVSGKFYKGEFKKGLFHGKGKLEIDYGYLNQTLVGKEQRLRNVSFYKLKVKEGVFFKGKFVCANK